MDEWLIVDKSRVRITVDVADAQPWRAWAYKRRVPKWWRDALRRAGGGDDRDWYVVMRPIPASEWRTVEDTATGEQLQP